MIETPLESYQRILFLLKKEQIWARSIALVTARQHDATLAACRDLLCGLRADFDSGINQTSIDIPDLLLQTGWDLSERTSDQPTIALTLKSKEKP